MVFVIYKFGAWKKEIRELLRKRLNIKDKIRYHKAKIIDFKEKQLPMVEEKLQMYLDRVE